MHSENLNNKMRQTIDWKVEMNIIKCYKWRQYFNLDLVVSLWESSKSIISTIKFYVRKELGKKKHLT